MKIHIGGGSEHQRTADPEVREQHFPKSFVERLFLFSPGVLLLRPVRPLKRQLHIFQRKSLQPHAPGFFRHNRDEGRRCPYHTDPEFFRHPVSVPFRTGGGIGPPSRREDHGIRIDLLTGTRLNTGRADSSFLFTSQYTFDGAVVADLHIPAFQVGEERPGHI